MASDRVQFERAMTRWEELHADGAYSVPLSIGRTAIIVSFDETFSSTEVEKRMFTQEAEVLAKAEKACGRKSDIILDAKGSDFARVLQDPKIVNVVTIGHGSLSYLYMPNDMYHKPNNRYDWRDVSQDADHLKSGYFIQRHCGNAVRALSVPLGAFAMTAHNSVLAAANDNFNPTEPPRSIIGQLTLLPTGDRLSYDAVKTAYPYNV